jgi:hypothetical protein
LDQIEAALGKLSRYKRAIRNDIEEQEARKYWVQLDNLQKALEELLKTERGFYTGICSQISDAGKSEINRMILGKGDVRKCITDYEELKEQGRAKELARLLREADEKKNVAQYTENPQKKSQAKQEAKTLEKEAKKFEPKVTPHIAKVQWYNVRVDSRHLAAKQPEHLVHVDPDEVEFNKDIKEKAKAGIKITANMYPGLTLIPETRVRFH